MDLSRDTAVILWLSLNLLVIQFFWMKAEKQSSYLAGRASVFEELSSREDGTGFDCSRKPCK